MRNEYIYFKDIPLYREFTLNGYRYQKNLVVLLIL